MAVFLGMDIGTTSVKAALFDESGTLLCEKSQPNPPSGEHGCDTLNPATLWHRVKKLIEEAVASAGVSGREIAGVGFASLAETVIPVDADGPLFDGILWYEQCTRPYYEEIVARISEDRMRELTSLDPSWIYSASKIAKFKAEHPDLYARTKAFLDVASYLIFIMTGEIFFDSTIACRTHLLDVGARRWSQELCDAAGVDMDKLPSLRDQAVPWGSLKKNVAEELGLRPGIVVTSAGHDHIASAFGSGMREEERAMISVGTSAAFYSPMNPKKWKTPAFQRRTSLTGGYSAFAGGGYGLTGMTAGGFCIDWFIHKVLENNYAMLDRFRIGRTDALFLPNMRARVSTLPPGGFTKLSDKDTGATLLQAIMESLAFECRYTLEELFAAKGMEGRLRDVIMLGGGAMNAPFVSIVAHATGRPIRIHGLPHTSCALGCAMAGAIASGRFKNYEEAAHMVHLGGEVCPEDDGLREYLRAKYNEHMKIFRGQCVTSN